MSRNIGFVRGMLLSTILRRCGGEGRAATLILHKRLAMTVLAFEHLNIATAGLDRARRFYAGVVGLRDGPRPPFSRPGRGCISVSRQ